eukprot:TRINITY_DN7804_c0_g1_i1.p1 TRINITY_DN7804_c0_g1~~TRINITY_DN7804_c0_g1_i1.p1  ORF type:complete len:167 (+),score=5.71 TRINITY_DN7804_c0_g1_i1:65-565(+)
MEYVLGCWKSVSRPHVIPMKSKSTSSLEIVRPQSPERPLASSDTGIFYAAGSSLAEDHVHTRRQRPPTIKEMILTMGSSELEMWIDELLTIQPENSRVLSGLVRKIHRVWREEQVMLPVREHNLAREELLRKKHERMMEKIPGWFWSLDFSNFLLSDQYTAVKDGL